MKRVLILALAILMGSQGSAQELSVPDGVQETRTYEPNIFESIQPESSSIPITSASTAAQEEMQESKNADTLLTILNEGGVVGFLIIVLSVVAVALTIEHFVTIRRSVLIPPEIVENVSELLKDDKFEEAELLCEGDPSVLAYVLRSALEERTFGWDSVAKSAESALTHQYGKLNRKIDYLNDIGNIAPMLGLLGTVLGMLIAFRELAMSDGAARAPDLAQGIYLALITTVEGLIVAIPALGMHSFFKSRVANLIGEIGEIAGVILQPLKRPILSKKRI